MRNSSYWRPIEKKKIANIDAKIIFPLIIMRKSKVRGATMSQSPISGVA